MSREMGLTVPSRVSLLILRTQAGSDAYSRDSSRFSRRCPFIHVYRHTQLCQSRVHRVTQLSTDRVHCQESTGTGPTVVFKVVPVTGAASAGHHEPMNVRLSFPTSKVSVKWKKVWECIFHVFYLPDGVPNKFTNKPERGQLIRKN